MPLFAFASDNFESQNSHSTNARFDQLRRITTFKPLHSTTVQAKKENQCSKKNTQLLCCI